MNQQHPQGSGAASRSREKQAEQVEEVALDQTMPHQISAPDFKRANRPMQKPFVNEFGVVIGDSCYNSPQSPLNQWSTEIDPAVMAGDRWVHPTNDIGWNTEENRELVEENQPSQGVPFMHPSKDVGYGTD
ncbi:MAG: DUF3905 domain-containing protein [Brevibacillus sp.]|nr:DUF3905 domain-containing protein [Brevibacillus sp.]